MICGNCGKNGATKVSFTPEGGQLALCDGCFTENEKGLAAVRKGKTHDRWVDLAVILFGCVIAAGFIAVIMMK